MCGGCRNTSGPARSVLSPSCQWRAEKEPVCGTENGWQQQSVEVRNQPNGDYESKTRKEHNEDRVYDMEPRDPYQVPGYSGHVPTLQYQLGETYGHGTHKVIALRAEGGANTGTYGKATHVCPVPMHEPYRLPGYTGHVPGLQFMVGGTFGQDTHKILHQEDDSNPAIEESLKRAADNTGGHSVKGEWQYSNKGRKKLKQGGSSGVYKMPEEHYQQPQYKYRIADTYATRADLTLVDPCVNEESDMVISTRELDDTKVVRTQDTLEERVQDLPYINKPIRHRPTIPGFDTFIDAMRGARGQRFELTDRSPSHTRLQQQLILQRGKVKERLRNGDSTTTQDPLQMCGDSGDVPYGYSRYGDKRQNYTNSALYDFTSNYRRRQSSEWAPATISLPDPPAFDPPGQIYSQHTGLLPGYSAHIPGAMFRCGKTFTDDSRDARKALRGDRF